MAWSPDGNVLAVGLGGWEGVPGGRVVLVSTDTGKQLAASDPPGRHADWASVAWSPDGRWLAGAGLQGARVWDRNLRLQPIAPASYVFCLDWSPDSKRLAAGSRLGIITIYEPASGTPLHVVRGHGYVTAVQWHPAMPRIASVGQDGFVRIWNSVAGDEVCAIQTQTTSSDYDCDWSPDGWQLATAGTDGSVRIWDASPADRYFKRHQDVRDRVWQLLNDERKGVMRQEYQEALDLLGQLRALHPGDKDLQWQTKCVEWYRAARLAMYGSTEEGIALFKRLTDQAPDLPDYRLFLPNLLFIAGKETEAIALLEAAVAGFPQRSEYHEELAFLYERRAIQLCESGELSDAVAILHKLAHEFPERPGHRAQVVRRLTALLDPGGQAIEVFRRLVQEFPDAPEYREELSINLSALAEQGKHSRAEAKYREVLRLRHQERYAEAEAEYQQVVRLRPGFDEEIANPGITLLRQRRFAAAARYFAEALAAGSGPADDLVTEDRYDGACAAVLAGCGQGEDAAQLDHVEQTRLRRQALDWLRADLTAWGKFLEKQPDQARVRVPQELRFWQQDADLSGVRGAALARLPEAERQAWQQLWNDVEQMLKRVNQ